MEGVLAPPKLSRTDVAFSVTVASWLTLIFAETLAIDYRVWAHNEGSGALSPLSEPGLWLYLALGWPLIALALLATQGLLDRLSQLILRLLRGLVRHIFNWMNIVILLFLLVVLLAEAVWAGGTLRDVLEGWTGAIAELWDTLRVIGILALISGLAYLAFRAIRDRIGEPNVRTAYNSWLLSSGFLVLNWLIFYGIWAASLGGEIGAAPNSMRLWRGFFIVSAGLTVIAVLAVSGLARWSRIAAQISPEQNRWISMTFFVMAAIAIAIPALVMDLIYVDGRESATSTMGLDYPEQWQRDIIGPHVVVRDWGLLLPLCVVMLLWVAGRILALRSTLPPWMRH